MVHLLTAVRTYIEQRFKTAARLALFIRTETAAEFLGQLWCQQHHFTQQCRVFIATIGQSRDMFAWHDQKMDRRFRLDVMKGDQVLIFIHQFRRYCSSRYLAKNAVIQNLSPTC